MKKTIILALLLGTTLSACAETPMPAYKPSLSYANTTPYNLDVAETILINDSRDTALTADFAQKFGTTLESSLREWMHNRIQTNGNQGAFSVIIKNANFTATSLNKTGGIEGYFTRDQAARWDGELTVMLSADGSGGKHPEADITINVRANSTIPEKASQDEKSKTYHSLINQLMTLYNQEAEKQMQLYMNSYIR